MMVVVVMMMMVVFWGRSTPSRCRQCETELSCSLDAERIALVKLLCGAMTLPNRARSGAPEVTTSLLVATASQ